VSSLEKITALIIYLKQLAALNDNYREWCDYQPFSRLKENKRHFIEKRMIKGVPQNVTTFQTKTC